ncbi:MAG: ABC transporter permease, partial [Anaerolineae bacterium]|nr:ABC transporter permease [Anaerolineae bacterium]
MSQPPTAEDSTQPESAVAAYDGTRSRWLRIRNALLQGGPVIALLALCLFLTLSSDFFLTESNLSNVARRTSIIAILAIGQTFVILASGIDL